MDKFIAFFNFRVYFTIAIILCSYSAYQVNAQISTALSSVSVGEAIEGKELSVSAQLLHPNITSNVSIAFRSFTESEFTVSDMEIIGNRVLFTIPASVVKLPVVVYYIIVELNDGTVETYPLGIPETGVPEEVTVKAADEKDKEILILNPTRGEIVPIEDFFISVSLIKASDNVNSSATKIILNNTDITDKCLFAGDLILFYSSNFPDAVSLGAQNLRVEVYDSSGALYHSVASSFNAETRAEVQRIATEFSYRGNFQAESRNENFNNNSVWYNNFTADFAGNYGEWRFGGYTYFTSEEDKKLQPQHRFSGSIESSWLNLKVGDSYPRFPELVMNGKRVRGISGGIELGIFNVHAAFGEVRRSVEGALLETYSSDEAELGSNFIDIDSAKYGNPIGRADLGTYSRDIFAVRPSFGSGEAFQWGLTYLHSKDDVGSIEFGGRPQENALAGTDLSFNLDNRNIVFRSQAFFSLFNSDISEGSLTDEEIDKVFSGEDNFINVSPNQVKRLKNIFGDFMTVNQFVGPINPGELSSLAAEASLELNYFNNRLRAKYLYRGNDYESFGQEFIRNDIKGFNISDRVRLLRNKLFLTLGYERLEDNLQETKIATTTFQRLNTSVSFFPRIDFPNITIGYSQFKNENDFAVADTSDIANLIDNLTNRFTARFSYDIKASVKHGTSLNFMTSERDDKTPVDADASTFSTSLSVNSFWTSKLSSFVSLVYFSNDIAGVEYKYITISAGGRYKLLDNKLVLNASITPSFGDFKRQALDIWANYDLMENLLFTIQVRVYRIPDESTNSVSGVTVSYRL